MSIVINDKRNSKSVLASSLARVRFFEFNGELYLITRSGWALKLGCLQGNVSVNGLLVTPVDVEINIVG